MKETKVTAKKGYVSALVVALIAALIGAGIYAYTSMTGYLAGRVIDWMPVVFTAVAAVLLLVLIIGGKNMKDGAVGFLTFVINVLLAVAICLFAMARIELAADIYFIPVNYPQGEATAFYISIVGLVGYLVAIVSNVVASAKGTNK